MSSAQSSDPKFPSADTVLNAYKSELYAIGHVVTTAISSNPGGSSSVLRWRFATSIHFNEKLAELYFKELNKRDPRWTAVYKVEFRDGEHGKVRDCYYDLTLNSL